MVGRVLGMKRVTLLITLVQCRNVDGEDVTRSTRFVWTDSAPNNAGLEENGVRP